jgi:hypothetical protein
MAAEKVKERLQRATAALEAAGIAYAVIGGNAVAEWVGRVDEDAVRNTRDVDLLVRREDFPSIRTALEGAGFVYADLLDVDMFLDGPEGKPSSGVHLLYAGELTRGSNAVLLPSVTDSERGTQFQVANLEALVRMKLIANRDKDRTHLRDMIGVGLIDSTWPSRFPAELAERLQAILDDPFG